MKRIASVIAIAATAAILAAASAQADAHGPGTGPGAMRPGAMMGQGMMGGQGTPDMSGMMNMMNRSMGGQGMPGMMGPGAQGQGMGPGMIGRGMPGMGMGPQEMFGHGMRGGGGSGQWFRPVTPSQHLTIDDVRHDFEHRLERYGNKRLKLGEVKEADKNTIVADIVTVDDSLVDRLKVDRHTGRVQRGE